MTRYVVASLLLLLLLLFFFFFVISLSNLLFFPIYSDHIDILRPKQKRTREKENQFICWSLFPFYSLFFPFIPSFEEGSCWLYLFQMIEFDDEEFDWGDVVYGEERKRVKCVREYILGKTIGKGSYGKVKDALNKKTLRRVAMKIVRVDRLRKTNPAIESRIRNEIAIMKRFSHLNIVELIETFMEGENKLYVVMEFVGGGTMMDLVRENVDGRLNDDQIKYLFPQLVDGLDYIHSKGVIHQDIKPDNILLSLNGDVKISDFGAGDILDTFNTSDVISTSFGSPAFFSPEAATGKEEYSGTKADIWAAGITLYFMATGELPFRGETLFQLFESIKQGKLVIPECVSPAIRSLIEGMLCPNEDERMEIEALRKAMDQFRESVGRQNVYEMFPQLSARKESDDNSLLDYVAQTLDDTEGNPLDETQEPSDPGNADREASIEVKRKKKSVPLSEKKTCSIQ
eukprot:TRINITY_DN7308_c0_g1_i1.p1 TRINITY_DN7308_c0_g1~~TRINITY_DN7308_c0_g1_i1.p1  ORF type:complete len:458 (+),score=124.62 TRINITY_DN7308_c0_g1_i1:17-1390(+)